MNLQQLRYLVALADHGTLTQAGNVLKVSQPALSRAIHDLEDEFGTPIVRREGRTLSLTPAGKAAVVATRRMLAAFDEIMPAVERNRRPPVLRIAVSHSLSAALSGPLSVMMRHQPSLHIQTFNTFGQEEMTRMLLEGLVDIGFGQLDTASPKLVTVPSGSVERVLVSPPGTQLPPTLPFTALDSLPLINLPPSRGRYMEFDSICEAAGIRLNIVFETDDPNAFIPAVRSGIGSCVAWKQYCLGLNGVEVRSFEPPQIVNVGFLHPRKLPPEMRRFLQLLKQLGAPPH
jgi:DNA-binding transcriptional LysR family regulator